MEQRERTIVKVSIVGIVTNVLLAGFKAAVGIASHSIAFLLDAVNNLSDVLSSVVTVIGAKLGAKRPDREHPHGHGRIEYVSSLIIASIIIYAGVTALIESIKKIASPVSADYDAVAIIVISVSIVVKLLLGQYVKAQGRKVDSSALTASGADALMDALLSASVLASAVVYLLFGLSLEAYVGVLISVFIIKAGAEIVADSVNDIIGGRGDAEMSRRIKALLCETPEVRGAYDLNLFNFGPGKYYGSVHIELPDTMTVDKVDVLTRKLQIKVYEQTGVVLTGIGVYSHNTTDPEITRIRETVQTAVLSHEWALQMHGFFIDRKEKYMRFDVVISFDVDRKEALDALTRSAKACYPDYRYEIALDINASD